MKQVMKKKDSPVCASESRSKQCMFQGDCGTLGLGNWKSSGSKRKT